MRIVFALVKIGKKALTFGTLASVDMTPEQEVEVHRRCADLISQVGRIGVATAVRAAYLRGMADARCKPM
jgi:hypothetical protein